MDGIKLSVSLQLPTEKDRALTLEERVEDALECLEYRADKQAYEFIKKVNNCLAKKFNEGKRCPRSIRILKQLTPFLAKHGLQDPSGVILANELVTDREFNEEETNDKRN